MATLEKHYVFYLNNEQKLLSEYNGLYLVIPDDLTVHAFKDKRDAYYFGEETYGLGHFLLQHCDYNAAHTVNSVNVRVFD